MHVTLLQENLKQALQNIQKGIPLRPALPILSCILMKTESKSTVSLAATDLQLGIRSTVSAKVTKEGVVAVPAKVFIDYIMTLEAGDLELELKENTLTIIGKGSRASFQCFVAADYPPFPEKEGQEISLPTADFYTAVQQTSFATSVDEARPILTANLFVFGENLEIVGTDGFRLATVTLPVATPSPFQLLLPAKALNEVVRISQRKQSENIAFTVSEKLKQVFFSFDDVDILMRLLDGDFPPYQKIIPAEFSTQITFNGEEFEQKLKTALVFARESSGIIKLAIAKDQLKISSSSSSLGNQESTLSIQVVSGGEAEIAFNAKYLVDFLHTLKPEEVSFCMNESLKPALFRPVGADNYRYIVMPFRVNQ